MQPRFRHTERLPVGSGAWLSLDRQGKGGEHRRRGCLEGREHRAHFWKSPGKGRWGTKGAAKVQHQTSTIERFGQR